jgi:cytochrome P450
LFLGADVPLLSLTRYQFLVWTAVYNLYLHPLSSFPGPKLWAITRLPYVNSLWRGRLHTRTRELHDRYGSVVRLAPNELSFIDASAWRDIYTGQNGNKGFPKNNIISGAQGFYSLTDANDIDHSRFRGLIQKSFSAQALQAREGIFHRYVGLFVKRLQEKAEEGAVVNIVDYLNWTTFDITGELTFSESFGCLEGRLDGPWIAMIFSHLKASALLIGLRFYAPLDKYLMRCIPKRLSQLKEDYIRMSKEKVHRRINNPPSGKPIDFMTPALKTMGQQDGMTLEEIEGTFTVLIIGGSETTATTIAGITNYLCHNTNCLKKLVDEVRAFKTESELTMVTSGHLPYLNAVIQEGLRLCTPLPSGLPRIVSASGAWISGRWVAGGVSVEF